LRGLHLHFITIQSHKFTYRQAFIEILGEEDKMAKPTTYATPICVTLSIITVIGIGIGLLARNPLIIAALLLPAVIYEVYRTEGESTIWSSWLILGAIIAEFVLVIFKINFDLASFLGTSSQYIAGYYVPLGDIKVIFPTVIGILSVILFLRTAGIYTKWLSVLIFLGALSIVYTIDPGLFQQLIRLVVQQGMNHIGY